LICARTRDASERRRAASRSAASALAPSVCWLVISVMMRMTLNSVMPSTTAARIESDT
jgi:hypothetical protein